MKRSTLSVLVATVLLAGLPSTSVAATEIQFWHAMTAVAGERVNDMAAKFNTSQSDFVVKAVHKGSYAETLPAAITAYQAKQPPHIVQVADRGTQRMLSSGAVYPVYQLMKDYAKNPNQKTAVDQMNAGKTTPNSQGHRLGNSIAIRDAIEEQMEHIFSGNKTPKQGLDDAVAKGNEILKEFAARS